MEVTPQQHRSLQPPTRAPPGRWLVASSCSKAAAAASQQQMALLPGELAGCSWILPPHQPPPSLPCSTGGSWQCPATAGGSTAPCRAPSPAQRCPALSHGPQGVALEGWVTAGTWDANQGCAELFAVPEEAKVKDEVCLFATSPQRDSSPGCCDRERAGALRALLSIPRVPAASEMKLRPSSCTKGGCLVAL